MAARPTAQRTTKDVVEKSNQLDQQRNAPQPRLQKDTGTRGAAKGMTRDPAHNERAADATRSVMGKMRSANAPAAHLTPDDKQFAKKKEVDREAYKSPSTGRATKLGRRVEKPQDPKAGGPSGQKDRARHDKRHANK